MFSFVVAVAKNNVIGKENDLAWYLPDDVRFFKEVTCTSSKTMIMGRRTFDSLPKVLPGRKHIVLTRDKDFNVDDKNVEIIHDMAKILHLKDRPEEYFVIGGAEIFRLFFPYTDRLYLTEIHHEFAGDTFFPEYDKSEWEVTDKKEGTVNEENRYPHTYLVLNRVK